MKKLLSFLFITLMPVAGFADGLNQNMYLWQGPKQSDDGVTVPYAPAGQEPYAPTGKQQTTTQQTEKQQTTTQKTEKQSPMFDPNMYLWQGPKQSDDGVTVPYAPAGQEPYAATGKQQTTTQQTKKQQTTTQQTGKQQTATQKTGKQQTNTQQTEKQSPMFDPNMYLWQGPKQSDDGVTVPYAPAGQEPYAPTGKQQTTTQQTKKQQTNTQQTEKQSPMFDPNMYLWQGPKQSDDSVTVPYAPAGQEPYAPTGKQQTTTQQTEKQSPTFDSNLYMSQGAQRSTNNVASSLRPDDQLIGTSAKTQKTLTTSGKNTTKKTSTTAAKRPTGNGAGYCKLQTRDFTSTSDYDMDEYLYRDSGTWEFYASSRARPVGSAVQVYECNGRSDAPDDACPEGATKILRAGAGIGNQTVASTGEYVFVCTNNSSIKSDSYKWLYTPIQERCLYTSSNIPTQDNIDGQMLYYSSDYNVYCRKIEQVATKAEADQKMGPAGPAGRDGKDGKDGKDGRDGIDGKDGKDGRDGKDATQAVVGPNATGMHTIEATAKITTSRNDATSMQSRQSASQSRISRLSGKLKEMQEGFKVTVWRNEDGTFNTTRLASDSIAAVVLGTTGGLVTSHVIKKNQVNKGFDDIQCTVGGQSVAGWGDEFRVGIQ